MKTFFLNQQPIKLDPAQLLQSGGEGMVFGRGDTAVKLYHQPTEARAAKLRALLDSGLAQRLPEHVLAPSQLLENDQGQVAGFQMKRLPAGARPFKQLSNPTFCQAQGISVTAVAGLLRELHSTLTQLHGLGVVVGDLNDHNLFFLAQRAVNDERAGDNSQQSTANSQQLTVNSQQLTAQGQPAPEGSATYWLDVDSYQFGAFACPVALDTFLDPRLYAVPNFSQRPSFSPPTDWYAFLVLLVKSLLQVHPYGGSHHGHKSLRARAEARLSILDPTVIYPQRARPLESLPDDLLHHLHRVFALGERPSFPGALLASYSAALTLCAACGLRYPATRPGCPACRRAAPVARPTPNQGRPVARCLLRVDGHIVHLSVTGDGRLLLVVRSGSTYRLVNAGLGGISGEKKLFDGRAGYRFGAFGDHYLVVNPAAGRQLLVLDVGGGQPQRVALLETGLLGDEAVFAVTPGHLYRMAQGAILRGAVQWGHLVEDVVATGRQNQTWLWGSPHSDRLAGYYRSFAQRQFFVLTARGAFYEAAVPPLRPAESMSEAEALFSPPATAFLTKVISQGQAMNRVTLVDGRGRPFQQWQQDAAGSMESVSGQALVQTTLLHAGDEGIIQDNGTHQAILAGSAGFVAQGDSLHPHPAGLLVRQSGTVYLLTKDE